MSNVIVVDNGSQDDSASIAATCGAKVTVLHCHAPGACNARNLGLAHVATGFVHFMDADDYVEPHFYTRAIAAGGPDVDLIVMGHRHVANDGRTIREVTYAPSLDHIGIIAEYLVRAIQTGGFVWRRAWLETAWDESLTISQDAEFVLRQLLRRPNFTIVPHVDTLAIWREHGGDGRISNSFNQAKAKSSLTALLRHRAALEALDDPGVRSGLALRFYDLAQRCYVARHRADGDVALRAARELGLTGNPGSGAHSATAALLGLPLTCELKVRFTEMRRRLARSGPSHSGRYESVALLKSS